jgi:hypothetical protein
VLLLCCVSAWLGGCVYVGGVNQAPDGVVEVVPDVKHPGQLPGKGEQVTLQATATDPDGDPLQYAWRVQVLALEDGRSYRIVKAGPPDNYELASVDAGDGPVVGTTDHLTFQLPLRGSYTATVTVSDALGAQRRLTHGFAIENRAPVIPAIAITRDERATSDRVPDVSGLWPVHAHYQAWIPTLDDQLPPKLVAYDPEGDLSCAQADAVRWEVRIEPPGAGALDYAEPFYCPSPQDSVLFSRLYFRFLPVVPPIPVAALVVTAKVTDSFGASTTVTKRQLVVPNRPPCIVATLPPFDLPQVIVLHDEGKRFEASEVSEDVNDGLSYTWLVRDEGEPAFSEISGQKGAVFVMPADFRTLGQKTELRAMVRETAAEALACAESTPLCQPPSAPNGCYQWITWTVVFQ